MQIAITTHERDADADLFETDLMQVGIEREIADGVTVRFDGTMAYKALDLPSVVHVTLVTASSVAAGVASNALWAWLQRLKERPRSIEINKVEIEFDEGSVKRVFVEQFKEEN